MVVVVTTQNRHHYMAKLEQMFQQRHRIFIEHLHWDLPCVDNDKERDAFDTDETIYLLSLDTCGNIRGASRLLPTLAPHLLSSVFSHLVDGDIPRGEHIWESSRSYVMPEQRGNRVLGELFLAMLEVGLLFALRKITFVCNTNFLLTVLHAGWDVELLGTPQIDDRGDELNAASVNINLSTLQEIRRTYDIYETVLDPMSIAVNPQMTERGQETLTSARNSYDYRNVTYLSGTRWVSCPDIHHGGKDGALYPDIAMNNGYPSNLPDFGLYSEK